MNDLISEQAKKVEKNFYKRLEFVMNVYGYDLYSLSAYLRSIFPNRRITARTLFSWSNTQRLFSCLDFMLFPEICRKFHVSSDYLLGLSDEFHVRVPVKKVS